MAKIQRHELTADLAQCAAVIAIAMVLAIPLAVIAWRAVISAFEQEARARIAARECPPSEAGERLISSYFDQNGQLTSCRYARIDADFGRATKERKPAKK